MDVHMYKIIQEHKHMHEWSLNFVCGVWPVHEYLPDTATCRYLLVLLFISYSLIV